MYLIKVRHFTTILSEKEKSVRVKQACAALFLFAAASLLLSKTKN